MRRSLVLAAAVVAATAAPSFAQELFTPYCSTRLTHVEAGLTAMCTTVMPPMANNGPGFLRVVNVAVQEGAVDVTLECAHIAPVTVHVAGLEPRSFSMQDSGRCTVTLVATETTTTAVATSTPAQQQN
jgi:hypothetical protein